jgi:hypothetical protein
MVPQVSDTEAM